MRTIEVSAMVDARPPTIWSVLTDFESYNLWEPFVRISGNPALGADLQCHIKFGNEMRRVPGDARITEFDPPSSFAWAITVDTLLRVEERYLLHEEATGTKITHQLRISGWFGVPLLLLFKRMMNVTLSLSDHSLRMRIQQLKGRSGPSVNATRRRKGRRK